MRQATSPTRPLRGGSDRPRRVPTRLIVVLAGLLIAAVVASILVFSRDDSGSRNPSGQPSTQPSTTAADPEATARAAVLDAYRKSFEQFVEVASDPNAPPDDARLAEHTTGNALIARQAGIFRLRTDGQVFTGSIELHPTVVELGGGTATVADCNIDRTSTVDIATGKVLSPPATEGAAVTSKLRVDASGVWKQYEFKDEKRTCVPGS